MHRLRFDSFGLIDAQIPSEVWGLEAEFTKVRMNVAPKTINSINLNTSIEF